MKIVKAIRRVTSCAANFMAVMLAAIFLAGPVSFAFATRIPIIAARRAMTVLSLPMKIVNIRQLTLMTLRSRIMMTISSM